MKSVFLITAIVVATLSSCQDRERELPIDREQTTDTLTSFVSQARHQSRLYTSEYNIHKIVTFSDEVRVKGTFFSDPVNVTLPLGDRKIAIPIDVTLKAYIDFSQFDETNVKREGSKIIVTLPDPKVMITASRIDHKATKQYVSLTRSDFSEAEINRITNKGEESIKNNLHKMNILDNARENAAHTLTPILTRLGYKDSEITIRFRKDFTPSEFKKFVLRRNDETPAQR